MTSGPYLPAHLSGPEVASPDDITSLPVRTPEPTGSCVCRKSRTPRPLPLRDRADLRLVRLSCSDRPIFLAFSQSEWKFVSRLVVLAAHPSPCQSSACCLEGASSLQAAQNPAKPALNPTLSARGEILSFGRYAEGLGLKGGEGGTAKENRKNKQIMQNQ
ncbi:hypothetical protein Bbelb_134070 [Branchiostoma belcheri]|nr:hypothetical protein Bbelb_134070 [Branchiostoma belcheri]